MSVSITVRLYFTVEKVVLSRGSDAADATEIMSGFIFLFLWILKMEN